MAIKSNVDFGLVELTVVGDNTVVNSSNRGDRYAVSAMSIYNTTGASINVQIYESPNLTSASGVLVDEYDVGANDQVDVLGVIGQGYTDNLIAVPDATGTNIKTSGIDYSGADV
ncbi:MAG: hypothetical protein CMI54_04565 [Parcubacteria group bacterium]|nr:hypothetical protein [Parcubacteria group bacterium]|tara:strand:+ start:23152 stop:23493 length:342 start_codon:yes stop_codon:yes gene_type:complete